MDRLELTSRYAAVSVDSAREAWDEMYESCLEHCMHGATCNLGAACNQGRRITTVRPPLVPGCLSCGPAISRTTKHVRACR